MLQIVCVCLALSLLIYSANATNYIIDSSVSSSSPPVFTGLKDAVPYIINSGTISENITVTLKKNTVGINQTIPNFNIQGGLGGVDIVFEDTPSQLSSSSDCSLLPLILISQSNSNSVLSVSNIDYFSFTGVTLKIVSDSYSNLVTGVKNVTLTHVCMLNSDPTPWNYSTQQLLSFASINMLTVTNLVTIHNSFSTVNVISSNLVIQSWQVKLGPSRDDVGLPIIRIQDNTESISATITDLTVTCSSWTQTFSKYVVYAYNAMYVNITNGQMFNCYFEDFWYPNFLLENIKNVVVDQFTFKRIIFVNSYISFK